MRELKSIRAADVERVSRAAAASFVSLAVRDRLVDVAFATVPSPLGDLLVAATPEGIVRVAYDNEDADRVLEDLSHDISPKVLEAPGRLDEARRELDEYFEGIRHAFDVEVDLSLVRGFTMKVLEATTRIPYGSVSSYRDVAARAGSPRAARAAGNALHDNPVPIVVPCHRVLHSNGGLGGYGGRLDRKEFLLRLEGAL